MLADLTETIKTSNKNVRKINNVAFKFLEVILFKGAVKQMASVVDYCLIQKKTLESPKINSQKNNLEILETSNLYWICFIFIN